MTSTDDKPTTDREERRAGQVFRNCCERFKDAISFVPKNATPPNWGVLWLVFLSLFSSAFTLAFLFPFLPEMVKSFGYSEEEKGTYVGLIASSVFAGRAAGSFFWGWLSDLRGRKLVLLITIAGNGLFSFLFGFVHSLPVAMVLRFLAGLANGTVGVAKTVLYDVSDNTNQAFSMSVISISWGSGLILGPTIGGYLALPADKYPTVFSAEGLFGDFPFILPSACCLVVCLIAFIVVFFRFKEPEIVRNEGAVVELAEVEEDGKGGKDGLNTSQPLLKHEKSQSVGSSLQGLSGKTAMSMENLHCELDAVYFSAVQESDRHNPQKIAATQNVLDGIHRIPVFLDGIHRIPAEGGVDNLSKKQVADNSSALLESGDKSAGLTIVEVIENHSLSSGKSGRKDFSLSCWRGFRHSSLVQLLSMKDVRDSVALYSIFSFAVIGYDDVFTIFASTSPDYDGLGFSTDEIGIALGAVSIPLMFIQLKIYPNLVAKFGIKKSYLICVFFIFIPIQLIPMLHLLAFRKVWLWVGLVVLTLPMRVAMNSCFAGSAILINNSVTTDMAGKANGLAMTATAVARTFAPTLGGAMFAWSLKASSKFGPPLDVSITFVFFGFIVFINALQCLFLPSHLDHQKK